MSYSPAKIEPEKDNGFEADKAAMETKPAPSWFVDRPGRDLADAYRSQREAREKLNNEQGFVPPELQQRRLDERFENARRMFDKPERDKRDDQQLQSRVRRPVLTPTDMHAPEVKTKAINAPVRKPRVGRFLGMSAIALVIGGGVGFGFAKRDVLTDFARGQVQQASVSLPNFTGWSAAPAPAPVSKKEVSMASLDVNDARGTLNSMIPLMLHAAASDAANPIDIKISGLPPSAYLSAGKRSGVSDWTVKTNEIDGLKLVVPNADQSRLDLEVAALDEKSGALAAPVKSLSIALDNEPKAVAPTDAPALAAAPADVIIQPVSAPPDTSGNNFSKSTTDGADYLTKGDELMKTGDIASARQFYMKASELGNGKGSYGVARTYDPKVFAELNVQGMEPDPTLASQWYQKAAAAGVTKTP